MPRDKDVKRVVRKRMAETGERYTEARAAIRPAAKQAGSAKHPQGGDTSRPDLVPVEIPGENAIRVQLATGQHFVVLKERNGSRSLPIWIGLAEANAIAVPLLQWKLERPMTADLMTSTIRALGGVVERVVVTRFESGCFFAEVHVRRDRSPLAPMDARPSDAIGIAVRTKAPIFVASDVMDTCTSELEDQPDAVAVGDALAVGHARARGAGGEEISATTYTPRLRPTHVLIDVATDRVLTLLSFPKGVAKQPEAGTLMTIGTPGHYRQYQVIAAEPDDAGLTKLRAEAIANPTTESSHTATVTTFPDR